MAKKGSIIGKFDQLDLASYATVQNRYLTRPSKSPRIIFHLKNGAGVESQKKAIFDPLQFEIEVSSEKLLSRLKKGKMAKNIREDIIVLIWPVIGHVCV